MENQDDLERALKADGYRISVKVMGQMALSNQFAAVAGAQMIIGGHGAELFWLILLGDHGTLLEFSTMSDDMHYKHLALYAAVRYD
jgi:capsular polysaccharide biosynthesis protein